LDVWYIRNASLWLDLRIIGMTLTRVITNDHRCEEALAKAMLSYYEKQDLNQNLAARPAAANGTYLANATYLDEASEQAD
jgi:hypothetical protein